MPIADPLRGDTYQALAALDEQNAVNLRSNLQNASTLNPDAEAGYKRIADAAGVPVDSVRAMPDEAKRVATMARTDTASLIRNAPALAKQLQNPDFAAVAHDDIDNLQSFERTLTEGLVGLSQGLQHAGDVGAYAARSAVAGATYDFGSAAYGWLEGVAKYIAGNQQPGKESLPGVNGVAEWLSQQRKGSEAMAAKVSGTVPTDLGFTEQSIVSGTRSFGQMAPATLMSVLTGSPTPALAAAGMTQGGQSVVKGLETPGVSPGQALAYGAEDATAEIATEMLPVAKFVKDIRAGAPFLKILGAQIVREVPTELAATAWQNFNEYANLHPDQPFSTYLDTLPAAEAQTVIATVTTTLLMAGVGGGINAMAGRRRAQIANAETRATLVSNLMEAAKATELMARDPSSLRAYFQTASENGPLENVWINPKEMSDAGVDIGALAKASPSFAAQMTEALAVGGDVRIPTAELLTTVPNTGLEESIIQHLRTQPGDMSLAQAQTYAQKFDEYLAAEVEKGVTQGTLNGAFAESSAKVESELLAQLEGTRRFTTDVNKVFAKYAAATYATLASRVGMMPEELYVQYPLRITGEQPATPAKGGVSTQQTKAAQPEDFARGKVAEVTKRNQWAIMTPENPGAQALSPEANAARMEQFKALLDSEGIKYEDVQGQYGGTPEHSLILYGVPESYALDLGRRFGQESVLTPRGLVYQDATYNPATGVTEHATPPGDFFSIVPRTGAAFTVDINFDERLPLPPDTAPLADEQRDQLRGWSRDVAAANTALDEGTLSHEHNVAALVGQLARVMGLPKYEAGAAVIGAMAHDVGKADTFTPVMLSAASLTPEEYALIREHPAAGVKALTAAGVPEKITNIVGAHHLNFNEQGGYGVPIEHDRFKADLLHAADVFTSIATTDAGHKYRKANMAEALKVLADGKGTKFNPIVVDAITRIAQEGRLPATFYPPGRVNNVVAIHFSREARPVLDTWHYGTGMKGAEGKRLANATDSRIRQRLTAYVANENGAIFPESGVGYIPHAITVDNLYDAEADPLELFKGSDFNASESAVLDHGFDGYVASHVFGRQGALVLLGGRTIKARVLDGLNEANAVASGLKTYGQSVQQVTVGGMALGRGIAPMPGTGEQVTVVSAPTRDAAEVMAKRSVAGSIRGFRDEFGTLHVWDASRAIHQQVMRGMGMPEEGIFGANGIMPFTRFEWTVKDINNLPIGTFSGEGTRYGQGWYRSALTDEVAKLTSKQASGQGWKEQIKGLVGKGRIKQAEVDAIGLNDWLDLQQGKVTKEQLETFVKDNGVRVEEVTLGETPDAEAAGRAMAEEQGHVWGELSPTDKRRYIRAAGGESIAARPEGTPKFASYQLPGGENYRELLLTLPSKEGNYTVPAQSFDEMVRTGGQFSRDTNFRSSHFDQPNILAHVRFNERTDADGKRVLFLEELQSDWAQKGRKEGFAEPRWTASEEARVRELEKPRPYPGLDDAQRVEYETLIAKRAKAGVPSAPFVGKTEAWTALALKRMIRYAAENGFDRVAWTTGEQQAARYDLSTHLDRIEWAKEGDRYRVRAFTKDDPTAIFPGTPQMFDSAAKIADVFGKDVAEHIERGDGDSLSGKFKEGFKSLTGENLKVGGEGMKGYYDKIVPSVANDVLKKLGGGKVREVEVGSSEGIDQSMVSQYATQQPGFDITPTLKANVLKGVTLFQGAENRGTTTFGENIRETPTVIALLHNANLSTFLHEMAHFQLEMITDLAGMADAPVDLRNDVERLFNWFGVKDLTEWHAMPFAQKERYHEQMARGMETYLFEGKAPSVELNDTFARIRSWMLAVYRNLTNIAQQFASQFGGQSLELSDEVRGVFDRLLATEQEIATKQAENDYAPMFESAAQAGMTPAEWQHYQEQQKIATETAVSELAVRGLRDMKWMANARSRMLRALQKDAAARRSEIEREVTAEVRQQPIYRALHWLKTGDLIDANGDVVHSEVFKLDTAIVLAEYPELKGVLNNTLQGLTSPDGLAPDLVAEMTGLSSGDELMRKLIDGVEPEAQVVERETNQRALLRYGDLVSQTGIERAADEALHNDVRARFVATEMAMLDRALGNKRTTATVAKDYAAALIARQKVRTLRPSQYSTSAVRAGKAADKAFKTGDIAAAATEKRNQLINTYAAKAAYSAAEEVAKSLRYLKAVVSSEAISVDYRNQIANLLERFYLRPLTTKELNSRESLLAWVDAQKAEGLEPVVDERLLDEAHRVSYKNMTVEEFRGLVDTVKNVEHLGRLKKRLLTAQDDREFAERVSEAVASVEVNATRTLPTKLEHNSLLDRAVAGVKEYMAWHRRFANKVMQLDGWKDGGVLWELLVRPANHAAADEATRTADITKRLVKLFSPMLAQDSVVQNKLRGWFPKKTFIPEINDSLSREGRIMVALYCGEEGNLQRLRDGDHWTDAQIKAITDRLTQEDWTFVRGVWEANESFRPEIGAQQLRLTGLEPEWLEPRMVDTPYGQIKGGYMPARYDTQRSTRSLLLEAGQSVMDQWRGATGRASTRASFTKARAKKVVNRPLLKSYSVITQHFSEVIHRLSWQDYMTDANRVLSSNALDTAIRERHGPEILKSMRDDLKDTAIGDLGAQNIAEAAVSHVRNGATIVGLGFRLTTALMQFTGFTQTAVRIGPKWLGVGMREFLGDAVHMENTARRVYAMSEFMVGRGETMQRELNEILGRVAGDSTWLKSSYFYLIQKAQLMVDLPTWLGGYHKALAEGRDESTARDLGDQAVKDAQGSGQIFDLAGVQRGSAYQKLFTNFMSYFVTRGGLTSMVLGRTKWRDPASVGKLAVDLLLLYTVPAALVTLMQAALKGENDPDKLAKELAADQLSYLMGGLFGVREMTGAAQSLVGLPSYDYKGPPGIRFLNDVNALGKQIEQGDADLAAFKAANETAGILFHYPAGQLNTTVAGLDALIDGRTENPGALIAGAPRK
jgi:putative nucleotidyltransferase with HDIG domain